jgi:hypothetical protein
MAPQADRDAKQKARTTGSRGLRFARVFQLMILTFRTVFENSAFDCVECVRIVLQDFEMENVDGQMIQILEKDRGT